MANNNRFLASEEEFTKFLRNRSRQSLFFGDMQIIISTTIINYRKSEKLTQGEFAKFMGVSQGMVSKWESGEYNFTINNIAKICDKLNISPTSIFSHNKREYLFKDNNEEWSTNGFDDRKALDCSINSRLRYA